MEKSLQLYAVALRNLLMGGNLKGLSLLGRPSLMIAYATENLFSLRTMGDFRGIPQKNVFEVLPEARNATVKLSNGSEETWFRATPSYVTDIVSLCLLCQAVRPNVIFEIGTFLGYTSAHMALNSGEQCKIFTLDLPPDGKTSLTTTDIDREIVRVHQKHRSHVWDGLDEASKINPLLGDSATYDFSAYHKRVDLFFIDGAHSYEYVRSDTLNAVKCCRPGSVIAWHDFGRAGVNGVSKWLVEFAKQYPVYSVPGGSLAFCVLP